MSIVLEPLDAPHCGRETHINSRIAYREQAPVLRGREKEIVDFLEANRPYCYTDREVMTALGYTEPNQVRPRITKLLQRGQVRECQTVRCDVTGMSVRTVSAL